MCGIQGASLDCRIGVIEFADDNGVLNLGSLCLPIGVKEIIANGTAGKSLGHLMDKSGIVYTSVSKQAFGTKNLEQDLERLCVQGSSRAKEARGCLAALIGYSDLTSDAGNHGKLRGLQTPSFLGSTISSFCLPVNFTCP
jgi:hypothetical protein